MIAIDLERIDLGNRERIIVMKQFNRWLWFLSLSQVVSLFHSRRLLVLTDKPLRDDSACLVSDLKMSALNVLFFQN